MPRNRTALEQAAGKLILRIQQEWMQELGEPAAADSEQVMNRAHDLLQAASAGRPGLGLQQQSIEEFLGREWLCKHPGIQPFINDLVAQRVFCDFRGQEMICIWNYDPLGIFNTAINYRVFIG